MTNEKSFLMSILKRVEYPKNYKPFPKWLSFLLWIITMILFIVLFQLAGTGSISNAVLAGFSALIGSFIGIYIVLKSGRDCWQFLFKHIDKRSIKERLSELES